MMKCVSLLSSQWCHSLSVNVQAGHSQPDVLQSTLQQNLSRRKQIAPTAEKITSLPLCLLLIRKLACAGTSDASRVGFWNKILELLDSSFKTIDKLGINFITIRSISTPPDRRL